MICICYPRQVELLAAFQNLPSNIGSSLAIPADLMPAIGALSSALMNAATALAAAPGASSGASSAQPAAAAEVALSANPSLQAAGQLAALAGAAATMNAGLGVNMSSPSAAASFGSLGSMLADLIKTLAELPLYLLDKLLQLAAVGELIEKFKDLLDVDLEAPDWVDDLGKAVNSKLADAASAAEAATKDALSGLDSLANDAAKAAALLAAQVAAISASSAAAVENSTAATVASATAALQTGLGVDLMIPGALDVLGKKVAAMKGTMSSMPGALDPASAALLLSPMKALSAIDSLRRTLGIDVLSPGAGGSLQDLLDSLGANLSSSGSASSTLNGAASTASALGGAASGSGGAGASASGGAGGALGAAAGASASSAASASLSGLAASPLMNPALAQMMAGMPAMPLPWMLLSSFCVQVQATLGIQLIAHGPCE